MTVKTGIMEGHLTSIWHNVMGIKLILNWSPYQVQIIPGKYCSILKFQIHPHIAYRYEDYETVLSPPMSLAMC